MSDERTEKATPRKQGKEREKGNISKSHDLNASLAITGACVLSFVLFKYLVSTLKEMFLWCIKHLNPEYITTDNMLNILTNFGVFMAKAALPFMLIYTIYVAFILRALTGNIFAFQRVKIDFSRFSGERLWKNFINKMNLFHVKNIVELVKCFIKFLIVGSCGYNVLISNKVKLFALQNMPLEEAFAVMGIVIFKMLIMMCIAIIILGVIDKKYQDYEYEKSIKMTKNEVKDEHKSSEGDPTVKRKIKSIQMKMAMQRMMGAIKTADVVVTNPSHYAVAIKYNRLEDAAPIVVAKGVDYLAFKIREVAKEHKVPIVENKPLARSLYKMVDVGKLIPVELYTAVAEVLTYVYNKNRKAGVR